MNVSCSNEVSGSQPGSRTRPGRGRIGLAATLAVGMVAATAAACGSDSSGTDCQDDTPNTVENTVFAPALGVDVPNLQINQAGVYFHDEVVGTGIAAEPGDIVRVAYTGWLPDGTEFDSNATFAFILGLSQVIVGWDRGVEGMQVGGIRQLVIPPPLAYGLCPFGPIPGNSVLIFDIEMLEITP